MDLVEILKAALFGIVQGITEWLPISSTGHMILLDELVPLNMSAEFMEMFFVVIQFGAILSVILLFWNKLCPVSLQGKPHLKKEVLAVWPKILLACVPAGILSNQAQRLKDLVGQFKLKETCTKQYNDIYSINC